MATIRRTSKTTRETLPLRLLQNSNLITKHNTTDTIKEKLNKLLKCVELIAVQKDTLMTIRSKSWGRKTVEDSFKRLYVENLYELYITKSIIL
jgi:hypothetical protein